MAQQQIQEHAGGSPAERAERHNVRLGKEFRTGAPPADEAEAPQLELRDVYRRQERTLEARRVMPRHMVWRTDQDSVTMLAQWTQR